MNMTDFQTSFIQIAFYGSYAVFAIPAALLIRRFNFKIGILVGLALYASGTFLFYPAGQLSSYGFYLVSNCSSEYFDANDLDFLIKGASMFHQNFPDFSHKDTESKNKILETATESDFLEKWLSKLIYYTIEAMFSDPIYGGNTHELGWTSTLLTTEKSIREIALTLGYEDNSYFVRVFKRVTNTTPSEYRRQNKQ
jgi:AraC-like DNA-binding protein